VVREKEGMVNLPLLANFNKRFTYKVFNYFLAVKNNKVEALKDNNLTDRTASNRLD